MTELSKEAKNVLRLICLSLMQDIYFSEQCFDLKMKPVEGVPMEFYTSYHSAISEIMKLTK